MTQSTTFQDFQPLPTYQQTKSSNATWIAVATVKTDHDGSTTQRLQIISKR
ncbi:MAG: hypothetical protein F6K21_09550 [Symploca sp. SIO2D2]|nr:hypothetical protein [Symploca sp. SIO2G7]NEQ65729.1 hypothetical protein [Symploca sp. SIO2D2]NER25642.1 hypothetical protein [Symploca sp. SIO1C2]